MIDLKHLDLSAPYKGANLTGIEVLMIGEAVLNWIYAVQRLGHESPASTLDYTTGGGAVEDVGGLIVRDFVAWTCGRTKTVPGDPRERLYELIEQGDWATPVVDRLNALMSGPVSA